MPLRAAEFSAEIVCVGAEGLARVLGDTEVTAPAPTACIGEHPEVLATDHHSVMKWSWKNAQLAVTAVASETGWVSVPPLTLSPSPVPQLTCSNPKSINSAINSCSLDTKSPYWGLDGHITSFSILKFSHMTRPVFIGVSTSLQVFQN